MPDVVDFAGHVYIKHSLTRIDIPHSDIPKIVRGLMERYIDSPLWLTADGRRMLVKDLATPHLVNILKFGGVYDKPRAKMTVAVLEELMSRTVKNIPQDELANLAFVQSLPDKAPEPKPAPDTSAMFSPGRILELED